MIHDEDPTDKLRDAALGYAQRGIPIFPAKANKKPHTPHGFKDATTDPEQIAEWWRRWPDAGIAVPTGATTGLVVLDADSADALQRLEVLGVDGGAPRVRTARGTHVYFEHPGHEVKTSASKLYPGLDVRGDGGYVLVPPSPGKEWVVPLNGHLPELPPWFFGAVNVRVDDPQERFDTAAALEGAPEGARDETLIRLVGKLVAADVPRAATEALALQYAANCDPPFSESEALNKVARAYEHYGPNPVLLDKAQGITAALEKPPLKVVSFRGVPRPGPQRWFVDGLVPEGHATTFYGDGGNGKSLLVLHLGMSVALPGVDRWLDRIIGTAPVLFLDFELDEESQARRVYDLADGMGLDGPPENLHYISALGYSTPETVAAAVETVKERGAKLVIVDSVGMALQGDAESAKDVAAFFRAVIDPLKAAGATVVLVDHQAKRQGRSDGYANKSEFGSVYKRNLARSSIQVEGVQDSGALVVTLTQRKTNMGRAQDSLKARVIFKPGKTTVTHEAPTPKQIVEAAPNAPQKVLKALEARMGPLYPDEIAEATGLELKTVQNQLSALRGRKIENTGEKKGNAAQVRLIEPPL